MPKFLLISSGMADAIQLYDDIVRIDNDSNSIHLLNLVFLIYNILLILLKKT